MKMNLEQRVSKLESHPAFDFQAFKAYLETLTYDELTAFAGVPCEGLVWANFTYAELEEMIKEIEGGGSGDVTLAKVKARIAESS